MCLLDITVYCSTGGATVPYCHGLLGSYILDVNLSNVICKMSVMKNYADSTFALIALQVALLCYAFWDNLICIQVSIREKCTKFYHIFWLQCASAYSHTYKKVYNKFNATNHILLLESFKQTKSRICPKNQAV